MAEAVLISIASKVRSGVPAAHFRPIYYLGCKAGFASVIKNAIDEVDPSGGRVADLFSGTGAVGSVLGTSREVTAVDVQEYSRVLCSAVLKPFALSHEEVLKITESALRSDRAKEHLWCMKPLIDYEKKCIVDAENGNSHNLVELIESPPLEVQVTFDIENKSSQLCDVANKAINRLKQSRLMQSPETTMSRYFGGLYFSFLQAAMLDIILANIDSFSPSQRDTLKAAALGTASQIVNTVGKQFAQPIQPRNKTGSVKQRLVNIVKRDRSMDALALYQGWLLKYATLPKAIGKPNCLQQDFRTAITGNPSEFSVIYADPPYTRDHYSRFYHVLETMCLRDNPPISSVMKNGKLAPSRGVYRGSRHQSEFCIRSVAPAAFDDLFRLTHGQGLPLVLSYSPHEAGDGTHPRVVALEQILDLARAYYPRINTYFIDGITHNQLNRSGLKLKSREHAEVLIQCFTQ